MLEYLDLSGNDSRNDPYRGSFLSPVACVAVGKTGARNAGYLAAQILAIADAGLAERLEAEREADAEAVVNKDVALKEKLAE